MKKFTQLAIGDTFEFQGNPFLKTGPLTARNTDDGSQRMIPRSAVVSPLGAAPAPAPEVDTKPLPAEKVVAAFESYHQGCLSWLQAVEETDRTLAEKMREAITTAHDRFLADLQRL